MNLIDRLRGDLGAYKSIPFWSWNDRLEPEVLRGQIRDMKKNGIGGFFMHARGGLMTEYMSDEWFRAVDACLDEAKKQGMYAWAYDENGWPSGFAGMKLLEDKQNHAHYLTCEARPSFDPEALGCYRLEEGRLIRVTADEGESCICVYDNTNSSVVDILNWKIVRMFIDETHEKYAKRYPDELGRSLMGFFTDEPQYFRYQTAYSPVILRLYNSIYSEDLLNELGALFVDCEQSDRFRYRYWKLMNDTYTEAFAKQIYDWCDARGLKLTGHTIEERSLFGQMMCCAGAMPFYEFEHMPGMDWLGRDIGSEVAPKQVASVAQQLQKKQVITETFACCGWDVTPNELKRIAEWQYVNGVNMMCQHLYPYSIRGQRKRDYPAFYSPHNPWLSEFARFNDYFTRLGYMLSESREVAESLVIHPIHSAYMDFKRDDVSSLDALNDGFEALVKALGERNIGHHYADETLLAKHGQVNGRRLCVGVCSYSYVIVPDMRGLDSATVRLLREYQKNGGRLFFAGKTPPKLIDGEKAELGLSSNITFDEIRNPGMSVDDYDTPVRSTMRRADFGDFLYAVNLSKDEDARITYRINARGAREFLPESAKFIPIYFKPLDAGGIDIPLNLATGESKVIFFAGGAESAPAAEQPELRSISPVNARITEIDENALTLDYCAISYDNIAYTEPLPVMAVSDRLLRERKNGVVYIKYVFNVKAKPPKLRVEAERMHSAGAWLNAESLAFDQAGTQDAAFVSADISGRVRIGSNELVFMIDYYQPEHVYDVFNGYYYDAKTSVTESLVNCLSYETDIECVYLRGDFCVECDKYEQGDKRTLICDGGFRVTLPRRYVTLNSLCKDGFPFFAGSVTFDADVCLRGDERLLKLVGRYATAHVRVNGGQEKLIMFGDSCDISDSVRKGENTLSIRLTNSLRNLYGPFHNLKDPDSHSVNPRSFELYGTWRDGRSKAYTDKYAFTYFGLDELRIG